jgi:hypothetical protein
VAHDRGRWQAGDAPELMSLEPGTGLWHDGVLTLLGEGGTGEVYLAQDSRLGRRVATAKVRERDRHGVIVDHFHSQLWDSEP